MYSDIFFLFVGFFLYVLFLYSFTRENKTIFFGICFSLITLHDFVFINLSYYSSYWVTFILKAWQEYLVLFLTFLLVKRKVKLNKNVFIILLLLILLSLYGGIISLINQMSLTDTFISWRMYLLPILLPCLVYLNHGFKNISLIFFYKLIQIMVVVFVSFALYQYLLFYFLGGEEINSLSKNFRSEAGPILKRTLWFYDYFGPDHLLPRWFNMVRDKNIRATSFFVSPIIYTQILGVFGAFLIGKFAYSKRKINITVTLLITLFGIYLSQVRAGFIFFVITLVIIYFNRKGRINNYTILGFPLFLVVITFLSLILFKAGDASSLGRLSQYNELLSDFNFFGYGLGSYRAITNYDSLFISVIFAFGIFSIVYFKLHLMILKHIKQFHKRGVNDFTFVAIGLLGSFAAFSYIIFFHYTIGSAPLRLLYFIAFYYLYKNYESTRN